MAAIIYREIHSLSLTVHTIHWALKEYLRKRGYKMEQDLPELPHDWNTVIVVSKDYPYNLQQLKVSDKLLYVISMMRRNRKVIYDFSAVDKQMLKTYIEQIIVTELNAFDRQILIEVYALCPDIITEDAPERTEYPAPIRVLHDLYLDHQLSWYAQKRHPKLINFIRDRLFEKGVISKMP